MTIPDNEPMFYTVHCYEPTAEDFILTGLFTLESDAQRHRDECNALLRYSNTATIQHLTLGQITTLLVKNRIRDLAAAIDRLTSLQTTTGEPASGPTGAHTYLVWCPSYGQSEADGREFTAETPRRAAQGWAWWHDQDSDKYRIVRGTPAVIAVKRLDTDITTQWTVQGRSLREYVATAHDATIRSTP
jgi:hypothetical protein